jgi:hypothetical protein
MARSVRAEQYRVLYGHSPTCYQPLQFENMHEKLSMANISQAAAILATAAHPHRITSFLTTSAVSPRPLTSSRSGVHQPTQRPPTTAVMAEYEAERLARIAENKRRMTEIGLAQVKLVATLEITRPVPDRL